MRNIFFLENLLKKYFKNICKLKILIRNFLNKFKRTEYKIYLSKNPKR